MDILLGTDLRRLLRTRVLPLVAVTVLALLVRRYDAPGVLALLIVAGASVPLLLRPETATLAVIFALYLNVPAIAHRLHGVPLFAAASLPLLLTLPLAQQLILRRERPVIDRTFLLMLLFFAVLLTSAVLVARDKAIAVQRSSTFVTEGLALYWLMINLIRRWATLRRVIWTLLAAGALLGSLSLYQAITGSYDQHFGGLAQRNVIPEVTDDQEELAPPVALPREEFRGEDRAAGPLDDGSPNRYAQIMIVLIPLALALARSERSRSLRLYAAAAGAIILGGVLLSYSRGAFLMLVVLLFVLVLLKWIRPVRLLVALLALGILVRLVAPSYLDRMGSLTTAKDLISDAPAVEADGSIRGRATEMLAALQAFLDHPVLGVGPGQYAPLYSMEYQQMDPDLKFRDIWKPRRAHTLYFELAAETGIIGLSIFMAIVLLLLRELWRLRRHLYESRPELSHYATAFGLSIVAYLGTAVFLHFAYERYYWLLLGVAGAAVRLMRSEAEHGRTRQAPGASSLHTA